MEYSRRLDFENAKAAFEAAPLVCLVVCPAVYPSACLSVYLLAGLVVYPSACLSVYLSVCPWVCLYAFCVAFQEHA